MKCKFNSLIDCYELLKDCLYCPENVYKRLDNLEGKELKKKTIHLSLLFISRYFK